MSRTPPRPPESAATPRTVRGHTLLGLLFLVGLATALIAALVPRSGLDRTPVLWLAGGVALAASAAAAMARRDRAALLMLLLFCTAAPALLLGMWAAFASGPQPAAPMSCGACALLAGAVGLLYRRETGRPELLPNVLRGLTTPEHLIEVEGLQLDAGLVRLPAGMLELRVVAQSCVDPPRTLRLTFAGAASGRSAHPAQLEARLGPAEVGLLRIALFPRPGEREPGAPLARPRLPGARPSAAAAADAGRRPLPLGRRLVRGGARPPGRRAPARACSRA